MTLESQTVNVDGPAAAWPETASDPSLSHQPPVHSAASFSKDLIYDTSTTGMAYWAALTSAVCRTCAPAHAARSCCTEGCNDCASVFLCLLLRTAQKYQGGGLVIEWIRGVYTPRKPSNANKPLPVTHTPGDTTSASNPGPWQLSEMSRQQHRE